jgi:predicted RNA-binding Zn ribbon-like protein
MLGPVKFIGGRLCLDFVNTVGARVSAHRGKCNRDYADSVVRDKIASYEDLLEWGRLAGIVAERDARALLREAASHPQEAQAVLARAAALREALYRLFKCAVEKWSAGKVDLETVRSEVAIARSHERLIASSSGFSWTWEREDALDSVLWPIAKSAVELLTSEDLPQLRQCGGAECGWMFLDASRNRKRHWCDMKDCGNRAKISRFRQRRAMG